MKPIVVDDAHSLSEYYGRLRSRLKEGADCEKLLLQVEAAAHSGEYHLERLALARRRYEQARDEGDTLSMKYELRLIIALCYEVADTAFIVINLLRLDELHLSSSLCGDGLAGDSSSAVVHILRLLDLHCRQVLRTETDFELYLDFSEPVSEKLGITYTQRGHWQDFQPGKPHESFYRYFADAQQLVRAQLNHRPHFWKEQTVREYLERHDYDHLLTILHRLEHAALPGSSLHAERAEKPEAGGRRVVAG